ncbi:MAG: hypothetical protein ACR2KP_07765 [Egibacteraceae bacterium]
MPAVPARHPTTLLFAGHAYHPDCPWNRRALVREVAGMRAGVPRRQAGRGDRIAAPDPLVPCATAGCCREQVVERYLLAFEVATPTKPNAASASAPSAGNRRPDVACPFVFRDIDHAWRSHSSAGPLQKVIDMVGADKVRDTLASVLEADRKPDGALRQDNRFRYVLATKPA